MPLGRVILILSLFCAALVATYYCNRKVTMKAPSVVKMQPGGQAQSRIMKVPSVINKKPDGQAQSRIMEEAPAINMKIDDQTQGQIMLGVRLMKEKGYSSFTGSVIQKYHKIKNESVYIVRHVAQHDQRMLQQWYGPGVHIIESDSVTGLLKPLVERFLETDFKILFLIDSDMVFLQGWRDFIAKHMIEGDVPLMSLYHSARMHDYSNDCQFYIGDLCRGNLSSTLGIAMSKEIGKSIVTRYSDLLQKNDWDEITKRNEVEAFYPIKSLVMKIGQVKQDEKYCGENEVPYGFQICGLPQWVQDGIEFYFDRCTNPEEFYAPGESLAKINNDRRLWVRPAISYSLYGSKTRYTGGALENSKRVFSIYPGWKVWIYIDNTVPKHVRDQLCENSVKFINMTGTDIINQMSWRFLIASEPLKMYAVRDIDSRLLDRGKAAVDEWIKSGKKFHVMRDHPNHSRFPISGGMWGGTGDAIPNMKDLIQKYRGGNGYLTDMLFLQDVIWKIAKESVWAHDSSSLNTFGEDHPFNSPWSSTNFVGSVDFS